MNIKSFQIFSAIFVAILGTLLHFTFEWSNKNLLVGIFSAVNESTWEHLKLLFYPMLLTTIIGCFFVGKNIPKFLCAKTVGIITSMIFTIVFFYTSSGIIGTNLSILNITIFYLAVILGEYLTYKIITASFPCNKKVAVITLITLLICFIFFTFYPPQIGLFKDPVTNKYGIIK